MPPVWVKLAVLVLPLKLVMPPEREICGTLTSGAKVTLPPEVTMLPVWVKLAVGMAKLVVPPVVLIVPTLLNVEPAPNVMLAAPLVCQVPAVSTLTVPLLVPVPPT